LEDNKTNEATGEIEDVAKTASEKDTQTPIKRKKTVSFSDEDLEQEIEEATQGKSSRKNALQLLDEIDDEIGKCYIPSKSALQLLAEIL
jgi:3-oxoacyl-ACP reductase-like protein